MYPSPRRPSAFQHGSVRHAATAQRNGTVRSGASALLSTTALSHSHTTQYVTLPLPRFVPRP